MFHPRDFVYEEGDIVPFYLNRGIVVASFFVSLVGSTTTVELLHRRTSWKGWNSNVYLGACAVSLGLVAIWCMHFIGNTAIIMGANQPELQLVYSRGYIAVSAFIPVIALFVAFSVADMRSRGRKSLLLALILAGIIAGLAILGMHYTANAGIANYHVTYMHGTIGVAMVIACLASVSALALFFVLQELWINHLIWRLLTALLLTGAVCGMHFEASMGTRYHLIQRNPANISNKITNAIIATVLCVLTLPVCALVALSQSRRRKYLAHRAQMVVLASATFDDEGRILVTQQGLLPCRQITQKHNQRAFEDVFNVSHNAFQWIYRVTHHWSSVKHVIPGMRQHLQSVDHLKDSPRPGSSSSSQLCRDEHSNDREYSFIFREGFCVAAADLANDLNESIESLGSLYDDIMMMGTSLGNSGCLKRYQRSRFSNSSFISPSDAEEGRAGIEVFGKGQLLVLMRCVGKRDATRLVAAGFRFAPMEKILDILARSMRIPSPYLETQLLNVWDSAHQQPIPRHPSTLLACFALRTHVSKNPWEVAVLKAAPQLLPHVDLCDGPLEDWKINLITRFDGWCVAQCLSWLEGVRKTTDANQLAFFQEFKTKIIDLAEEVNEPFFKDAIFSSKPIRMPRYGRSDGESDGEINLLVFHVIPDVHASSLRAESQLIYTPATFFKTRQQVLQNAPEHEIFARYVHQEFSALTAAGSSKTEQAFKATHDTAKTVSRRLKRWSSHSRLTKSLAKISPLGSNSKVTTIISDGTSPEFLPASSVEHGGVLVQQNLSINVETMDNSEKTSMSLTTKDTDVARNLTHLGTVGQVSAAEVDGCAFVDALFKVAVARWSKSQTS